MSNEIRFTKPKRLAAIEREARFRERYEAAGLVQVEFWIPSDLKSQQSLHRSAARLRRKAMTQHSKKNGDVALYDCD